MKRSLLQVILAVAMAASLGSCANRKGEIVEPADETFLIDSVCADTLVAFGTGADAPKCEVSVHLPFASGTLAAEFNDSVANFLIDSKINEPLSRTSFGRMMDNSVEKFIELFRSDMTDAAEDNPEYMRGAGYYLGVKYSAWDAPDSIMVFQIEEATFTGGAHGSYTVSYINVDKATGHVVSLPDICDKAHEEALTDAIVKQLMADYHCSSLKQLQDKHNIFMLCDEPIIASQFYLDDKGITFVYNEYEIAPYAEGVIKATLPYDVMRNLAPAAADKAMPQ